MFESKKKLIEIIRLATVIYDIDREKQAIHKELEGAESITLVWLKDRKNQLLQEIIEQAEELKNKS